MEIDKELLVNAVIGRGFRSMEHASEMTKLGLAEFSGNQWNPDWKWIREELDKLSMEELEKVYQESYRKRGPYEYGG